MNSIKIAILYNLVEQPSSSIPLPSDWPKIINRFVQSYASFESGARHDLYICSSGAKLSRNSKTILDKLDYRELTYIGEGWDIGAYQYCAQKLLNYDLVMFMNTQAFPVCDNWLGFFRDAYCAEGVGVYGASSSFEVAPHLRTAAFAATPSLLLKYPLTVSSREEACIFEHSIRNFTLWALHSGINVKVVLKKGIFALPNSRDISGVFRNGLQDELLIHDRHTLIFNESNDSEKSLLSDIADGVLDSNGNFKSIYLKTVMSNFMIFNLFGSFVFGLVHRLRVVKRFFWLRLT